MFAKITASLFVDTPMPDQPAITPAEKTPSVEAATSTARPNPRGFGLTLLALCLASLALILAALPLILPHVAPQLAARLIPLPATATVPPPQDNTARLTALETQIKSLANQQSAIQKKLDEASAPAATTSAAETTLDQRLTTLEAQLQQQATSISTALHQPETQKQLRQQSAALFLLQQLENQLRRGAPYAETLQRLQATTSPTTAALDTNALQDLQNLQQGAPTTASLLTELDKVQKESTRAEAIAAADGVLARAWAHITTLVVITNTAAPTANSTPAERQIILWQELRQAIAAENLAATEKAWQQLKLQITAAATLASAATLFEKATAQQRALQALQQIATSMLQVTP